ncbi:Cerato-platanin-domain-containing protein [Trichoderma citrinoviride]|uniref:Cerato-platanin-domain-containing protein n=1 Tax=Trichoderma citrinoviride TaxID=58853 RepID=A0A2T4BGN1_9HYPO|nr:Cerato-platanin-domain-containing protein [Trichoderma citrinoviride]PTB68431.1 Cerato-platanin-domain-containing protein [Trichoderma citrinoviride]
MHLSRLFHVASLVGSVSAETMTATFNPLYDDPSRSLSEVTCWRKNIGFMPNLDWTLQQDAAGFIGIDKINGLNSGKCLTCWTLSYEGRAISLLALDGADSGIAMSFSALQYLTDGRAKELGRVLIDAVEVDTSECGVPASKLHAYDF